MKILLTGHKGFIGQNLFDVLNFLYHVTPYEWGDKYPTIKDFDAVIHVGAISSTTEKDVEKIMRQNFDFTMKLYSDCIENNIPLQFSSSASLYGDSKTFKETDALKPVSPYAWSKYLCERHMDKNKVQILRYFNVYSTEGDSEKHKGSQASPYYNFRRQAQSTGCIKIFDGSDRAFRDFIHVDEVIEYHLKFLATKNSGIFNVGTGICKSFESVATEVSKSYGADIITIPMPENIKTQYQWYTQADMSKTKRTLGLI